MSSEDNATIVREAIETTSPTSVRRLQQVHGRTSHGSFTTSQIGITKMGLVYNYKELSHNEVLDFINASPIKPPARTKVEQSTNVDDIRAIGYDRYQLNLSKDQLSLIKAIALKGDKMLEDVIDQLLDDGQFDEQLLKTLTSANISANGSLLMRAVKEIEEKVFTDKARSRIFTKHCVPHARIKFEETSFRVSKGQLIWNEFKVQLQNQTFLENQWI
ncbi:hypothetical protein ACTFIU_010751 [Dictyostelium citrinum]